MSTMLYKYMTYETAVTDIISIFCEVAITCVTCLFVNRSIFLVYVMDEQNVIKVS